jgi:hypothetical protein
MKYLLLLLLMGWDWVSWYCGHYWPVVPAPDDRWWWLRRNWWNIDWQGKPKYSEKTCHSATLSTNRTWLDPGRRGGKPATNRLSYGVAFLGRLVFKVNVTVKWSNKSLSSAICHDDTERTDKTIKHARSTRNRTIMKYTSTNIVTCS